MSMIFPRLGIHGRKETDANTALSEPRSRFWARREPRDRPTGFTGAGYSTSFMLPVRYPSRSSAT